MVLSESPTAQVGANVRAEMARRRISQAELALHLGISQTGVSKRLSGTTPFDVNELHQVAGLLGVSVGVLMPTEQRSTSAALEKQPA